MYGVVPATDIITSWLSIIDYHWHWICWASQSRVQLYIRRSSSSTSYPLTFAIFNDSEQLLAFTTSVYASRSANGRSHKYVEDKDIIGESNQAEHHGKGIASSKASKCTDQRSRHRLSSFSPIYAHSLRALIHAYRRSDRSFSLPGDMRLKNCCSNWKKLVFKAANSQMESYYRCANWTKFQSPSQEAGGICYPWK